jgi:hypothetical protein
MGEVCLGVGRVAKTWVWAGFVGGKGERGRVGVGPNGARRGGTEARVRRKGGLFRLRCARPSLGEEEVM